MLLLKEMIVPLVVFDMKKARNPSFLDGVAAELLAGAPVSFCTM
jgi:hypothetical protein